METIWQGISNGLMIGWIYVLIALGLTLVFSIMRIVQFAHGEVYMLGAFCTFYISSSFGINFFGALLISILILSLVGLFLEKYLFRRFRGQMESGMIVAIGLILLLQTAATIGFGNDAKKIPSPISGVLSLWGVRLSWDRLLAVGISVALTVLLFLFLRKSKLGQAMVATSQNLRAAILQGVNVDRVSALSMIIGCALAAVAGGLMGSIYYVDPFMGGYTMAKGIAVIILGGLGSVWGAVIGGLILGSIDGLVPLLTNTTVASIVGFVVIIILLIIKPQGLLGHD